MVAESEHTFIVTTNKGVCYLIDETNPYLGQSGRRVTISQDENGMYVQVDGTWTSAVFFPREMQPVKNVGISGIDTIDPFQEK